MIVDGDLMANRRGKYLSHLLVVLFVFGWWWYARSQPVYSMPGPEDLVKDVRDLLFSAELRRHTYTSLLRVIISVGLALIIGTTIVVLAFHYRILQPFVADRLMPFFNAFPSLGWAMLGVIWFGVSNRSVIFIQTAILVPFTMLTLWEGMRSIDSELLEMAHSFTRSPHKVLSKVTFPLLLPFLFSSLRNSYGLGWKVALIAELFGATSGLGYLMNLSRQNFDTPRTLACVVVVVLLVYVVDKYIFQPIHKRLSFFA